jgi:hypothetical protein
MRRYTPFLSAAFALTSLCLFTSASFAQDSQEEAPLESVAERTVVHVPRIVLEETLRDYTRPVDIRLAAGLSLLKAEMASPTPPIMGHWREPIDKSSQVKRDIIFGLGYAGSKNPALLRQQRDAATDTKLRDYLTVALAYTKAQDTIPDLIRIFRTSSEPHIRIGTLDALTRLSHPSPPETDTPVDVSKSPWASFSEETKKAIFDVYLEGLKDPHVLFFTGCDQVTAENYKRFFHPLVADASSHGLQALGYTVLECQEYFLVLEGGRTKISIKRPPLDARYNTFPFRSP